VTTLDVMVTTGRCLISTADEIKKREKRVNVIGLNVTEGWVRGEWNAAGLQRVFTQFVRIYI
jgi:hypothetical protein